MLYPLANPQSSDAEEVPVPGVSRFRVRAVVDPSVLSRVVELFALRNLVPDRVRLDRMAGDELGIEVEIGALEAEEAAHIARRIRTFPTVVGVLFQHD